MIDNSGDVTGTTKEQIESETLDWQEVISFARQQAQYMGNSYQDAEDMAQIVAKKLYAKDLSLQHWQSYVRTMVKNQSIDLKRSRTFQTLATGGLPEPGSPGWFGVRDVLGNPAEVFKPHDIAFDIESNDLFVRVLAEVPENQRELFIDYLEGKPGSELARIYGYSSAASVAQTITRIRQQLREKFSVGDFES